MPTFSGMTGTYPPGYTLVSFWSNNAMGSGTTPATTPLGSSNTFPVGAITFHVVSAINDGLLDATFTAWNIYHVTQDQSTSVWTVPASIWLYGPAAGGPWEPVDPGYGVWWHNPQTFTTHVVASMFWATTQWISGVGSIEVIPEPASACTVLAGLGLLVLARRR